MVRAYLCPLLPPPMRETARVLSSRRGWSFFSYFLTWDPKSPAIRNLDLETRTSEQWYQDTREKTGWIPFVLSRQRVAGKRGKIAKNDPLRPLVILGINFHRKQLNDSLEIFFGILRFSNLSQCSQPIVINFEITSKTICAFSKFAFNSANVNFHFERKVFESNESTRKFSSQHDKSYALLLWIYNLKIFRVCDSLSRFSHFFFFFFDPAFSRAFTRTCTYFSFFIVLFSTLEKMPQSGTY